MLGGTTSLRPSNPARQTPCCHDPGAAKGAKDDMTAQSDLVCSVLSASTIISGTLSRSCSLIGGETRLRPGLTIATITNIESFSKEYHFATVD
jgi:hypothetical protein